ncbi:hypothetical protein TNCV_2642231 [Trichonephila clavipes]|nr:hypothetical protein TNCV_2642231 [Trichonephila clavipes]
MRTKVSVSGSSSDNASLLHGIANYADVLNDGSVPMKDSLADKSPFNQSLLTIIVDHTHIDYHHLDRASSG